MAAKKFLRSLSGVTTEVAGVQSSAGAANAGDIVALNDDGEIDETMLPSSSGVSESLAIAYAIALG